MLNSQLRCPKIDYIVCTGVEARTKYFLHEHLVMIIHSSVRICKTIILLVVLYWLETCSQTLREEHGLRVFENRVPRRISRPKRDELTRDGEKLHNEELHNLYSSPSIIRMIKSRRMRWAGHVGRPGRRGMHIGYW
jgi:hypothetical protein